MKRVIITYNVSPEKEDEFFEASENFAHDCKENFHDILEYAVHKSTQSSNIIHYISFTDASAQGQYEQNPRTQVFARMAQTYCKNNSQCITLSETGGAPGIQPDKRRHEHAMSLHKNQEEIDEMQNMPPKDSNVSH